MSGNRPNVLFLTVDALRPDRLSLFGYDRPTTPNLERLASRDTIVCRNAFSLGSFTQTAAVQLMTSSRPLSYNGYDDGARGRPATVFEAFKAAGYRTECISTLHWVNRFFGYDRGVDEEVQLFSLLSLPGVALAIMRAGLREYDAGSIDDAALVANTKPVLDKLFDDVVEYIDLLQAREPEIRRDFPHSPIANAGFDLARVRAVTERHREDLARDPIGYLNRHLLPASTMDTWDHRWLPKEWRACRTPGKLVSEAAFRAGNAPLAMLDPSAAALRRARFRYYPDAHSLAGRIVNQLENHSGDNPFFIWTHFMDTHAPYVSGHGKRWYRDTRRYLQHLGYGNGIDPAAALKRKPKTDDDAAAIRALYDAAVHSTDEAIGIIIDALDRTGLRDNTLVVISGDHGEELGEHGDFGHYFLLYQHNTHVPMVMSMPGIESRNVDDLVSILDLGPTMTDVCGVATPAQWDGRSVRDPAVARREHLLQETFYAGSCLFDIRPVYFGVRTQDFHFLWQERVDGADRFSPGRPQLFDAHADPAQQNDLYRPDHPAVDAMNTLIATRMYDLPRFDRARVEQGFGTAIADKAARLAANAPEKPFDNDVTADA